MRMIYTVLTDPFNLDMDSYIYRTGKLFDVVYLMGGNVRYNAMVSLD